MASQKLSAKFVKFVTEAGLYPDGQGLFLQVTKSGSKSWLLRTRWQGKRPEIGLGSLRDVSLAQARDSMSAVRSAMRSGVHPKLALGNPVGRDNVSPTFSECATAYIAKMAPKWSGPKQFSQWTSSIDTYANPVIGSLPVDQVTVHHIEQILAPHWGRITETMSRVRSRCESVLSYAKVKGYRDGMNPAMWNDNLEHLFPAKCDVKPVKHHPAMPYSEIPRFMYDLRARDCIGARALEFCVLTTTRNTECCKARWAEISSGVWTIPAERMKNRDPHRIPLTTRAVEILEALPYVDDFVFFGRAGGLSNNTLRKYLQEDMRYPEFTPHGFRSTFKDWCVEETSHPGELSEAQLAHKIKNATQAAYERGDKLQRRKELLRDWEGFCLSY